MPEIIPEIITAVDNFIWGPPLMILLVGTGLFLTVRFRFIQLRGFAHGVRVLKGDYADEKDQGEITPFQALSAALSATIGTGNIVGVAAAILIGGPGAAFWMWITALVGMATKYASCTLAVHYRKIDDTGEAHGGPMHFIEMGMGPKFKWLAVLFALFTVTASFGIGNMFQINNVAVNIGALLHPGDKPAGDVFNAVVGVFFAVAVGAVILGGIKSIGKFAAKIVPLMCIFYISAGVFILIKNASGVPAAFETILRHAFTKPEALAGGLLGTVIRAGVARGLFSNEAGLGSAAMAHGAARTNEPVRQGLVAMLGPFIDTIVVCSITALVIVVTGAHEVCSVKGELTGRAFELGLGHAVGAKLVAVGIIFFSFSTLISWSYYGDRAADYLLGKKAVLPYRICYLAFIVVGAMMKIETVIDFCDAMNGLMAIPNLVALIVLSPVVAKLTKDYFSRMKAKQAP